MKMTHIVIVRTVTEGLGKGNNVRYIPNMSNRQLYCDTNTVVMLS